MKTGDKVSWTKVSRNGRTVSMVLREGTIIEIGETIAKVKTSSRRIVEVAVSALRTRGQKSEITEFLEASIKTSLTRENNICLECGHEAKDHVDFSGKGKSTKPFCLNGCECALSMDEVMNHIPQIWGFPVRQAGDVT